jgi:hypothetical protein
MCKLIPADHNGDQARDLCNRSGEEGLQSSEAGIKWRSALGEGDCGKQNQYDDEAASASNPARPVPFDRPQSAISFGMGEHRHLRRPGRAAICRERRPISDPASNNLLELCDNFLDWEGAREAAS